MRDKLPLAPAKSIFSKSIFDVADATATDQLMPQTLARASMQLAMEAVTAPTTSYSLHSLEERQSVLEQRRREQYLAELTLEEDILEHDSVIDLELIAGAHLDELHTVLNELNEGDLQINEQIINDMVGLITELRTIMPQLPTYFVSEIKEVARPLRDIIAEYQNRVEVI